MVKKVIIALLLIATLLGCTAFSYKYYGLEAKSYEGTLLGPEPKDDIPFSVCSPESGVAGKCVVLKENEWFKLKRDYLEMEQRLIECQHQK